MKARKAALLVASLLFISHAGFSQATLVGQWTFEPGQELVDQMGNFGDLSLIGGASISNGQLDVGVGSWARGVGYTGSPITTKTLVSWVSLDAFNTTGIFSGGSALTIDKTNVDNFDAIVFAERQSRRWMAGSNFFQRTLDPVPGFAETTTGNLVQIAICYQPFGSQTRVTLYRNGVQIGSYVKGPLVTYSGSTTEILFGIRHTLPNGGTPGRPWLDAKIEEARIYQGCLSASDLQALTPGPIQTALVAPTNLNVDNSTAFIAPLTWDDNSNDEDGFQICRDGVTIATVGADVTSYVDTVFVFGTPVSYEVKAIRGTDVSDPTNADTYQMPTNFAPLKLRFDCYNPNTDMLTWKVENPNAQNHPFIYAQWWSSQRDTLFAPPGYSTFMTMNNPQSNSTWGDDNITGIWWMDETLTPGSPYSIVMSARLSRTCSNARFGSTPQAEDAGGFYSGRLFKNISFSRAVNETFAEAHISIGPNPVRDEVSIDLGEMGSESQVRILNTMGQQVKAEMMDLRQPQTLNLSELPAGVYMIEISSGGMNVSRKLIKQ